jgi:hypothetical protein
MRTAFSFSFLPLFALAPAAAASPPKAAPPSLASSNAGASSVRLASNDSIPGQKVAEVGGGGGGDLGIEGMPEEEQAVVKGAEIKQEGCAT